jgi:hypothetical protein
MKMKKMAFLVSILAVLALAAVNPASAAPPIWVVLDGETLTFDSEPMIIDGRTMVPMRAIFEALGATVTWDANTRSVSSSGNGVEIVLTVGSATAYKNGTVITLDAAPLISRGRTLVPLRFIAESFGARVNWDETTYSVYISTFGQTGAAEAPASTPPASLAAGGSVTWGAYAGKPLEWQVLEARDGKALLITKGIVDMKAYNTAYGKVTWEDCTLRKWLNSDFYNAAFSFAQKESIEETELVNNSGAEQGTPGASYTTRDKVFLLSVDEARLYFADDAARVSMYNGEVVGWWLRSAGSVTNSAALIRESGDVYVSGVSVSGDSVGIRPALWVSLGN